MRDSGGSFLLHFPVFCTSDALPSGMHIAHAGQRIQPADRNGPMDLVEQSMSTNGVHRDATHRQTGNLCQSVLRGKLEAGICLLRPTHWIHIRLPALRKKKEIVFSVTFSTLLLETKHQRSFNNRGWLPTASAAGLPLTARLQK